jgi:hypothetical protein
MAVAKCLKRHAAPAHRRCGTTYNISAASATHVTASSTTRTTGTIADRTHVHAKTGIPGT